MENSEQYERGRHEASIEALHYRLDEIKSNLERMHKDHAEEITRLDQKIEERVRPLEKFKAGCVYVGSLIATVGSAIVAWLKGGSGA